MKLAYAAVAMALAFAVPAMADDVPLNTPDAGAWNVYGAGQTVKSFHDKDVPGEGGKQVVVAKPTANTWDIGANVVIDKPIKKGDGLVFAVYLKLESKDAPQAQLDIPATIQINKAPYTAVIQGNLAVTTEWQLLYIHGTADQDYDGKATVAALNLGGAAKTLDLGPAYVLDQGQ